MNTNAHARIIHVYAPHIHAYTYILAWLMLGGFFFIWLVADHSLF